MTRKEGETYEAFVARAATNAIGRRVKYADLQDNADLTRTPAPTVADLARTEKYQRAMVQLERSIAAKENIMIVYLAVDQQVEVRFIAEGSGQPEAMKLYEQAVVVKHADTAYAKAGTVDEKGWFDEAFKVPLTIDVWTPRKTHHEETN